MLGIPLGAGGRDKRAPRAGAGSGASSFPYARGLHPTPQNDQIQNQNQTNESRPHQRLQMPDHHNKHVGSPTSPSNLQQTIDEDNHLLLYSQQNSSAGLSQEGQLLQNEMILRAVKNGKGKKSTRWQRADIEATPADGGASKTTFGLRSQSQVVASE